MRLFNQFGFEDEYRWGGGFPPRWKYTEEKLRCLNGTDYMREVVAQVFDCKDWRGFGKEPDEAIAYLNDALRLDGFQLVRDGTKMWLCALNAAIDVFKLPCRDSSEAFREPTVGNNGEFDRNVEIVQCSSAIANARSRLELVLIEIEHDFSNEPPAYDGNLVDLYIRVQTLLDLKPRQGIGAHLKRMCSGASSIVARLAIRRKVELPAHASLN